MMKIENCDFEIEVETKELMKALTFASSVVEKRNVNPNLNNALLQIEDNNLYVIATDMEIYLKQNIGIKVNHLLEVNKLAISIQNITAVVRNLATTVIKLIYIAKDNNLIIKGDNCNFELHTSSSENFPSMENIDTENKITINASGLHRLIQHTAFSMSNTETRYVLNGIYLHLRENDLAAVATDGHRLSCSVVNSDKIEISGDRSKNTSVIIPKKTINEISKLLKDNKYQQHDVTIHIADNKIKFEFYNIVMLSKIIDGNFPAYESLIPNYDDNMLTINREMLYLAMERAFSVTEEKSRTITFNISENKGVNLTASGRDKGKANELIQINDKKEFLCSYKGNDISISVNPQYLKDVLHEIKDEYVKIFVNDSVSPIIIKLDHYPKDVFVIMPLRV